MSNVIVGSFCLAQFVLATANHDFKWAMALAFGGILNFVYFWFTA